MIHLKRFNENIEESFFEMNDIEFYDRRNERTRVDMSQRTADDILSHISLEGSLHEMWESKEHYLSLGSTSRILKNGVIKIVLSRIEIYGSISETDDEWFWLWLHFRDGKVRCFKCDQLEGVFDCLKMLMLYEDKTI